MKKISTLITVVNATVFAVVLSILTTIVSANAIAILTNDTESLLAEWTKSWGTKIDGVFTERFAYVRALKHYAETTLDLPTVADAKRLEGYFHRLDDVTSGIVKAENFLDLYIWFSPEYSGTLQQYQIANMKLDGNLSWDSSARYVRSEMTSPSWAWFTDAEKSGRTITEPYEWEGFDGKLVSLCESLAIDGKTVGVVGTDMFVTTFEKELYAQKLMTSGYFAVINADGTFLFHPSAAGKTVKDVFGKEGAELPARIAEKGLDTGCVALKTSKGTQLVGFTKLMSGWWLVAVPSMSEIFAPLYRIMAIAISLAILALIAFTLLSVTVGRSIARPIHELTEIQLALARGNLAVNFSSRITGRKDELGILAQATTTMIDNITRITGNAKEASAAVLAGSGEISGAADRLSQGAAEQASSMEKISSSMEEMASNITQNSDGSRNTYEIAARMADEATRGGNMVEKSVEAVRKISEKISIIDEISRNTNLLALNAAIESARAGEAGKGFAVVASEIRKLAERSQSAASEISGLSAETVRTAEETLELIRNIVPAIRKTVEMLQEISAASAEQTVGADQINQAVTELDRVVQQNAAASDELSATARTLTGRSEDLDAIVSFFKEA